MVLIKVTVFAILSSLAFAQEPGPVQPRHQNGRVSVSRDGKHQELTHEQYLKLLLKEFLNAQAKDGVFGERYTGESLMKHLVSLGRDARPYLENASKDPSLKPLADALLSLKDEEWRDTKLTLSLPEKKQKNEPPSDWGKYIGLLRPSSKAKRYLLTIVPINAPATDETKKGDKTEIAIALASHAQLQTIYSGAHPKAGKAIEMSISDFELEYFDTIVVGRASNVPLLEETRATIFELPNFAETIPKSK